MARLSESGRTDVRLSCDGAGAGDYPALGVEPSSIESNYLREVSAYAGPEERLPPITDATAQTNFFPLNCELAATECGLRSQRFDFVAPYDDFPFHKRETRRRGWRRRRKRTRGHSCGRSLGQRREGTCAATDKPSSTALTPASSPPDPAAGRGERSRPACRRRPRGRCRPAARAGAALCRGRLPGRRPAGPPGRRTGRPR